MEYTSGYYCWSWPMVLLVLVATQTVTEANRCGSARWVECTSDTGNCLNDGTCCMSTERDLQRCRCVSGFQGRRCEIRRPTRVTSPQRQPTTARPARPTVVRNRQRNSTSVASEPARENRCGLDSPGVECTNSGYCQNGGTCCMSRETGSQICMCMSGYQGERCQLRSGVQRQLSASNVGRSLLRDSGSASIEPSPAVFRGAIQRDTYDTAIANRAIDGDTSTLSCTHITVANPWWAVELLQPSRVRRVKVVNDPGANKAYRLSNFYVWLSNTKPIERRPLSNGSNVLCVQHRGTVAPGGSVYVNCNSAVVQPFKYVIVQSSLTTPDALCLGEVEVFIDAVEAAVFRGAIQRDTYDTAIANRAIDGNPTTLSCTTPEAVKPWWAVELTQQNRVLGIKLINDQGVHRGYRLNNFYVWLSNTKPTVGQPLTPDSYFSCAQYNGTVAPGGVAYVTCGSSVTRPAMYVILQSSLTTPDALCLGEVEVYIGARNQTASTATCGQPAIKPSVNQRIVGGVEAVPHSWPWMVSLQIDYNRWCGGILISDRWVISAAHCSGPMQTASSKQALLGLHDQTAPDRYTVRVDIVRVIPSPIYGTPQSLSNDVMLIELAQPVTFNDAVSPVCLPSPTDTLTGGRRCYATGWGRTTAEVTDQYADRLLQVELPIIDTNVCNQPSWYNGGVDETMICAGYEEGGQSACRGDSGGPLVCQENDRWVLYGSSSWGTDRCADVQKADVYARISLHLLWINQTTRTTTTTGQRVTRG